MFRDVNITIPFNVDCRPGRSSGHLQCHRALESPPPQSRTQLRYSRYVQSKLFCTPSHRTEVRTGYRYFLSRTLKLSGKPGSASSLGNGICQRAVEWSRRMLGLWDKASSYKPGAQPGPGSRGAGGGAKWRTASRRGPHFKPSDCAVWLSYRSATVITLRFTLRVGSRHENFYVSTCFSHKVNGDFQIPSLLNGFYDIVDVWLIFKRR